MATSLTTTVLVENTSVQDLRSEHGLSVHLGYVRDGKLTILLLDFGQSDAFACNASDLGINLAEVDLAVLSHAHYDHADGMSAFFAANGHAPLYQSEACKENCWSTKAGTTSPHYIGINPGLLDRHANRMARVPIDRMSTIAPGVHVVPHTTPGLADLGQQAGMLLRVDDEYAPDDFAHEVSLVIELEPAPDRSPRLAVLNSCSHAGLPVITREVLDAFPGATIAAYVGGLHLVHASSADVALVADAMRTARIEQVYTGHCTGEQAICQLQQALPGTVHALYPGAVLCL